MHSGHVIIFFRASLMFPSVLEIQYGSLDTKIKNSKISVTSGHPNLEQTHNIKRPALDISQQLHQTSCSSLANPSRADAEVRFGSAFYASHNHT